MKTTLIVMAAGIGSRFGTGIKQLTKMNNNGELIIDFSIYDAKAAGFNKVVFIIRKDIEKEFKALIGDRIKEEIEVDYVYQDLTDLPEGFSVSPERVKPWGTGQAVLCCKDVVKEPFVIINADDYYGKSAFKGLHEFLVAEYVNGNKNTMAMAGFKLKNTLSENGTVTRGVCVTNEEKMLEKVIETGDIGYKDGILSGNNEEVNKFINPDVEVSMNMWAGSPIYFEQLEKGFVEFLENESTDQLKGEYLIPIHVDGLLKKELVTVKVIETQDKWIGITYAQDKDLAQEGFKKFVEDGIYPEKLW